MTFAANKLWGMKKQSALVPRMANGPVAVKGTASLLTNLCAILRLWLAKSPETGVSHAVETGVSFPSGSYCGSRVYTIDGRCFEVAVREVAPWHQDNKTDTGPKQRNASFRI